MSATAGAGKGGLFGMGSLNVGGHKIPYALIGIGIGATGLILVMRARQGGSVAALGSAPAAADTSVGVLGQGQEAQLANLSQQLMGIQQSLNPPGPPPTASTPTPPVTHPLKSSTAQYTGQVHNVFVNPGGQLEQQFYDRPSGKWFDELIGGGADYAAGSKPTISIFNNEFQVYTPTSGGATAHDWYVPGSGWHHALLQPGSAGETLR